MYDNDRVNNVTDLVVDFGETQIYHDDIMHCIQDACDEFQVDDLRSEGQRVWKAVMKYVGMHLFPDPSIYLDHSKPGYNYKDSYMLDLYNEYVFISNIYKKLISMVAFSNMLNIPDDTLNSWNDDSRVSAIKNTIWKRIRLGRRDCITDKAFDSNSPVGAMFVGNNEFAMNQPGVSLEATERKELTTSDIAARIAERRGLSAENPSICTNENGG